MKGSLACGRKGPLTAWRKYRLLTGGERALLHRAFLALPLFVLAMRLLGMKGLQRILAPAAASPLPELEGADRREEARTAAAMVARASSRLPLRATCLERSLCLWWLLRRRGIEGELRIGVRPREGGLAAHAWLEWAGEVLNDGRDVAEDYASFAHPLGALSGDIR